jgi:hypothetical protein
LLESVNIRLFCMTEAESSFVLIKVLYV